MSGVPCGVGQVLFDITENNPTACPACIKEGDLYWCGLIKHPLEWLGDMFGGIEWKCEAMAEIFSLYIGIGKGCGNSPIVRDVAKKMKERFACNNRCEDHLTCVDCQDVNCKGKE
jgi:hypothetical protein